MFSTQSRCYLKRTYSTRKMSGPATTDRTLLPKRRLRPSFTYDTAPTDLRLADITTVFDSECWCAWQIILGNIFYRKRTNEILLYRLPGKFFLRFLNQIQSAVEVLGDHVPALASFLTNISRRFSTIYCWAPSQKFRAGLTMVPNVPWHRAPAVRGPPRHQENFLRLFNCHLYREFFD